MSPITITRERRFLLYVFFLALVVRIALMLVMRSYVFPTERGYWAYGYEAGRIAAALARGEGFASPFPDPSGPTSWLAPIYPALLAAIFRIFGIYTQASAIVIFALQSLCSALTCLISYFIGDRIFASKKVGLLAAVLLAVYPTSIWFSINYIWDDSLAALCIAAVFLSCLYLQDKLTFRRAAITGLLMGVSLLVSPVVLAFYAVALPYVGWQARRSERPVIRPLLVAGFAMLLVLMPWLVRNYVTFGRLEFIKAGFGLELRIGNNPQATGMFVQAHGGHLHPSLDPLEFSRYLQMGEVKYSQYCYEEAISFIKANPTRFLHLSIKRIGYFWLGDWAEREAWLGNFGRRVPMALILKKLAYLGPLLFMVIGLFAAGRNRHNVSLAVLLFLTFPVVYYITHALVKYRYYIDTIIVVIGAYGLCRFVAWAAGILTGKRRAPEARPPGETYHGNRGEGVDRSSSEP
ncbi:MAG: glycosyltransferase family 39 protein [Acidobacteria bacterium]|nr:glycosyltransferase family 39 protein [Acidobacteriota bacterium]MBI3656056.1 glycosyltransferase family 39 protein [Acidobacteriota bacterium]